MKLNLSPFSINRAWRGGKRFRTKEYLKWQQDGLWLLKSYSRVSGEVTVEITVWTKQYDRADVDNFIKPALDLLVHAGIIDDDKFVVEVFCKKIKSNFEGYEIIIEPYLGAA